MCGRFAAMNDKKWSLWMETPHKWPFCVITQDWQEEQTSIFSVTVVTGGPGAVEASIHPSDTITISAVAKGRCLPGPL